MSEIFDTNQQFGFEVQKLVFKLFLPSHVNGSMRLTGAPRFFPPVVPEIIFSLKIIRLLVFFDVNDQYYLLQNPSSSYNLNKLKTQQSTSE